MIIAVPILEPGSCKGLVDQTLSLRAKVFRDILNWDVFVDEQGHELDQFDDLPGTYLLSVDEDFIVQASLRLLPTMGPYMASDIFAQLLEQKAPPRSPTIWEASRFFTRPTASTGNSRSLRYWASHMHNEHIAKLMCGMACYAREVGISHLVGVSDIAVERLLKTMGITCERLGSPQKIGNTRAIAGMFTTNFSKIGRLARTWGFDLNTQVKRPHDLHIPQDSDIRIPHPRDLHIPHTRDLRIPYDQGVAHQMAA